MKAKALRTFVVAWVILGIAGALDHTIAEKLFGDRIDLVLPHLQYGYVMFNTNLRKATVLEYAGKDGVRHDLADLVRTPAPGYKRARLVINFITDPMYLAEVCLRATRTTSDSFTFFVSDYDVDGASPPSAARSTAAICDAHGLRAQ